MTRPISTLVASFMLLLTLGGASPASAGKLRVIGIVSIEGIGSFPALSFSSGVRQNSTTTVSSTGAFTGQRADFTGLTVMKPIDQSSPRIFIGAASGEHYPTVRLDLYGAGSTVTTSLILSDVLITSVNQGGSAVADATGEEVTFVFSKVELVYNGPNGTTSGAWDLKANKKV